MIFSKNKRFANIFIILAIISCTLSAILPSSAQETSQSENKNSETMTTVLNVKDADIATLVKTFSKITKRNYIVDSAVKGNITIHLPTPVSVSEALRIFDTVLLLKGFTTIPVGPNVWKVVSAKDAAQTTVPLVKAPTGTPSDVLVTQLLRLKHVRASDMQQLLSKFVGKNGVMNSFSGTNSLILIDSYSNIERLKQLILELDVPAKDQELTIIPVLHAESQDIADKIKEILGEEDESRAPQTPNIQRRAATNRNQRTRSNATTANQSNTQNLSQKALPLKIIPDERTNSLIIVADLEMTAKVKALVEQLDSPINLAGGRFFVYRLKHADAEALSDILNNLISGASEDSPSSGSATTGSSLTRATRESANTRNTSASDRINQALERRRRLLGLRSSESEGGRVNFEGDVSIAPDPSTNSLIINASRSDYQRIEALIDNLDIKRRQVLVEATILEVSLTRDEGMGIELQGSTGGSDGGVLGQTNFGGLTDLIANPAALSDLTIAAASSGTITLPGGLILPSQALLVTALSRNSHVNVLSAPNILTTDNEEAEIIVGENVPFVSSTSTDPSNLNNTFNQIDRQDVGITLRITPQISTGNFVTLKVFVEISNVVAGTRNDPNGPTTTIRTTETTVEVRNGQMVVTGGLIADNVTESTRGIPFFQDIPIIGQYFQRQDTNERRNNLLVFITPRVIKDQYDARESTVNMRDSFESVVREYDSEDDRQEILHDKNIDRVMESAPIGDTLPTTITSPRASLRRRNNPQLEEDSRQAAALERTANRLKNLGQPSPISTQKNDTTQPGVDSDIIDITVKPKLGQRQLLQTDVKPSKQSKLPNLQQSFVVLRNLKTNVHSDKTQFTPADDLGTIGISVVGSLDAPSSRFFEVGNRYKFSNRGNIDEFICLGKFASPKEASIIHPAFDSNSIWHALTPQETLSLGSGPWTKG